MIQVRDLRVDYDDVCAVSDLTLEIMPGEVFGLIGPNGAGKTTTMRALMGLLEPTYGEVRLNNLDLNVQREEAIRQVGFMPDFAPLYEDLTVYEYLDLFAASYFVPPAQRESTIVHYLKLVDLYEKRDAKTVGLSRGMRQRLILAKTLLPEPSIIILDEPASGMDPHGRILLKQIMRELAAQGKTVLISSHILTELSEFCTSIGVMERGQLMVSGRVDEVAVRVLGQSRLQMEVFCGLDTCLALLAQTPGISDVQTEEGLVTWECAGGPEEDSALLAALVAAGVRVAAYGRVKEGLEDVFLKIGAKEVA